jgi:hypothetical protein
MCIARLILFGSLLLLVQSAVAHCEPFASLRAKCEGGGYQDFEDNGKYCPIARRKAVEKYNKALNTHSVCSETRVDDTIWNRTETCSENPDDDWTHACVGPFSYDGYLYVIWSTGYSEIHLTQGTVYRMLWKSLTSEETLQGCFSSQPVSVNNCTARGPITRNCMQEPIPGISQ